MCGIIRLLAQTDEVDTIRKVFDEEASGFRVVEHCNVILHLDDSEWDVDLIKTEFLGQPAIAIEIKSISGLCTCSFDDAIDHAIMRVAHRLAMLFEVA
jgi:hypothetical protein